MSPSEHASSHASHAARNAHAALTVAAALALVVLAACTDDRAAVAPPRPAPLPVSSNAWLLISDTLASAGSEVSIAGFARADSGAAIGSFTARFLYDSLQLQVIGPDSLGDNVLRAMNPLVGEYRLAGSAATGIPMGLLFRLRVKVIDPRGLRRLGLLVDALHSVSLADLTPRLQVQDTREALYAGMPNVRVAPPPVARP